MRSGSVEISNVLYRIAGEEGDPLQSNGVGEGPSSLRKPLIYPISLRSIGPFLPPQAVEDEKLLPPAARVFAFAR